jgi:hypothetical protein
MTEESLLLGRVLRANTATFTVGCPASVIEAGRVRPQFGGWVRAERSTGEATYGLIYNIVIEDDPFVRQLVAADVKQSEMLKDQRQKHQVPLAVDILAVGYVNGAVAYHRLPPQPPGALDEVLICDQADNQVEIVRFTQRHDWLRTVLAAQDAPADQLVAAALRNAAAARKASGQSDAYLISAGRELAKLLALDLVRLDGILRLLRD